MLFLGAGASRPMDIDDLSGITSKVEQLVSPRLRDIINRLKAIFEQNHELSYNFNMDIEVLFFIFNCLVNRRQMLNEMGPFALLMYNFVRTDHEFKRLEISNEEFQDFKKAVTSTISQVIGRYRSSQQQASIARLLYDELYDLSIRHDHQFPNALGPLTTGIVNVVATVNYDLVLEIYSTQTNIAVIPKFLRRGFKSTNGSDVLAINEITQGAMDLEYIKLHGSIDWWLNDQGKVVRSTEQNNPFEVLIDRTMIYPIYEKFVSKDPFFALYQYFRKMLFKDDIVIVIGYSFRDASINNAFLDWLRSKPTSRLIIVARQEKQNNIRAIFNNNARIQFVDTYFGQNGFINSLEYVLSHTTPLPR
jgi:hypothetical protein